MFREKLHKDLDGISPDEELLVKVTKMMQEEAAKPRQPKHIAIMRYAGMAAAVCMIAVGSLALYGGGLSAENSIATADYVADETKAAVQETALEDGDMETYCPSVDAQDGEEPVAFSLEEAEESSSISITAYYKGAEVDISVEIALEIARIAEKYMEENPYQLLDLMLSMEETEQIGEKGLRFKIEHDDESYTAVYIDDESSYVCKRFSTYHFSGEDKELILSYFE